MTWWMWLIVVVLVLAAFENGKKEVQRQEEEKEAQKRQKEAEDYIMNSGDPEAIKMLMLARANPANQRQFLNSSGGNSVLKNAAGIAAGVAIGEVVAGAVATSVVSNAFEEVERSDFDIGSLGD